MLGRLGRVVVDDRSVNVDGRSVYDGDDGEEWGLDALLLGNFSRELQDIDKSLETSNLGV